MVKCNNCGKELKEAIKILEEFLLILGSEYCYIDNRDTTKEEQAMETVLKYIKEESIPKAVVEEAIIEWDKSIAWANADDHYYAIKILQELLEE